MRTFFRTIFNILSYILSPLTFLSALWLKLIRRGGINNLNDKIFMELGVLPVLDHYYQPLINPKKYLKRSLRDDRLLTGVAMNDEEQLNLLSQFSYSEELLSFSLEKQSETEFYHNNGSFWYGDPEYLYNMVRHFKPNKIIEIGSGYSTLMVTSAVRKNKMDDPEYNCNHICIEPYEQPWLEKLGINLIREKVEDIDIAFFEQLESNDILFIDSSHIIRCQGDVLFEYLEILPKLKSGVIVHIHDIFTPKDYLDEWVHKYHFLWNEQYLLEAFLTFNDKFKIIGALNYLSHNYTKQLSEKCPLFAKNPKSEPRSFWIVRV